MKVRQLIEALRQFNQEANIYIFKNGEGAFDIDQVSTLIKLDDVMLFIGSESLEYKEKVIKCLDLKFEPKE